VIKLKNIEKESKLQVKVVKDNIIRNKTNLIEQHKKHLKELLKNPCIKIFLPS
jgi:hypothetical protein